VFREEFISSVRKDPPTKLLAEWLSTSQVVACKTTDDYQQFKEKVAGTFEGVTRVEIVGSGNWGYSLNPKKAFKPFDHASDIDVAVVSPAEFEETWKHLRAYQRSVYYSLSQNDKVSMVGVGNNVYCGFVSPAWAPIGKVPIRLPFQRKCNELSSQLVGYKPVKIMFFKSSTELFDYYKRGILAARKD